MYIRNKYNIAHMMYILQQLHTGSTSRQKQEQEMQSIHVVLCKNYDFTS